ncbi:MAG: hypothetical protein M3462_07905 [Chloroflexota bacterium]|nr:hypothetical protein [Chloroflexota bacterium]
MQMHHIVDQTFEDERLEVDGTTFERSVFKRCRIVFSAIDTVSFKQCHFDSCEWVLGGSARSTMLYLSALYLGLGTGGRDLVETMFSSIRDGDFGDATTDDSQSKALLVP